jgi:hypothetical protein
VTARAMHRQDGSEYLGQQRDGKQERAKSRQQRADSAPTHRGSSNYTGMYTGIGRQKETTITTRESKQTCGIVSMNTKESL